MVSLTALLTGKRTVSGDVRASRASQAKELHFAEEAHPVVAWNVTRACNLACAHCYLSAGAKPAPGELTPKEARALVEDLAAMRVPVLLLSGGEPLLRPDVLDLARLAHERGLRRVRPPLRLRRVPHPRARRARRPLGRRPGVLPHRRRDRGAVGSRTHSTFILSARPLPRVSE